MTENRQIQIEVMRSEELDDDLVAIYYQMLSQTKKNELGLIESVEERRVLLCAEITARKALSRLNGIAEGLLNLSCVPNGRSVVESGKGFLSVVIRDDLVCAAASLTPFGFGMAPLRPFRFAEAQQRLSDSEIRALVAASGYSLMDIVNADSVTRQPAVELYAQLCALKQARFDCLSDKAKKNAGKVSFLFENGNYVCSDPACSVRMHALSKQYKIAVAAVSRSE